MESKQGTALRELTYGFEDDDAHAVGKLRRAVASNYRDIAGDCTKIEVEQGFNYYSAHGRLYRTDTSLREAGAPLERWKHSYEYDIAGRVKKTHFPECLDGACASPPRSTTTTYAMGRPVAVPGFATSISYNDNATLGTIAHANGVTYVQTPDPRRMARPAEIGARLGNDNWIWAAESYAYDASGNIKSIGTKKYTYDPSSRLVTALLPNAAPDTSLPNSPTYPLRRYSYDGYGNLNRVEKGYRGEGDVYPSSLFYDANVSTNRLQFATYTASGSLAQYQGSTYAWDSFDQLAKVNTGSETWVHTYDVAGERVWSWQETAPDEHRVDTYALRGSSNEVLTDFRKDTEPEKGPVWSWEDYVYREGQLLGAQPNGQSTRHFDLDHLGSVRLTTVAGGVVEKYREFWPYGDEASVLSGNEQMQFTGHERDIGIASYQADDTDYMHTRYYRPLLGRFLIADRETTSRWRLPQSWNRYSYALGNPLKFVDPDGRKPYLVARNGPAYSSHLFIVSHARFLGDPRARIHSWGNSSAQGREGKLGRVDGQTTGMSEGTAATDRNAWLALGKSAAAAQKMGTDYVPIRATDGRVASVASALLENLEYHAKEGPNSNSAAKAVADRAQGSPVPIPDRYDPAVAVERAADIQFDDKKIDGDEKAGKHNENVPLQPPP